MDSRAIPVVLRHYCVPFAHMMPLYHGYSAAVSTRFRLAEAFDTTHGVLQEDTLLPHIFILLVDNIFRQSLVDEDGFALNPANGRRHPAATLTDYHMLTMLQLPMTTSGAECTLHWLQFYSEALVLKLNAARTKVLHV